MHIEIWPIGRVQPYPGNPRLNGGAIDAVAKSLREFGWRQPIVVDRDGVIVVGHTRWLAAKQLGLAEVPVHVAGDLTPAQAKAYRIADNQTTTIAEWDMDLLPLELADLKALEFDLDLLGFGQDELAKLMGTVAAAGLVDPDEVLAPPDEAITKPGDLIILGNIVCSAATAAKQKTLTDCSTAR
jgi:ParB-like chromosome segregation protein Spo0J